MTMVFPVFIPVGSLSHDSDDDDVVEYKETRVFSKFTDKIELHFKRKKNLSWWKVFCKGLDERYDIVIHASNEFSKKIEDELHSGVDFGDVYHKYKNVADIDDKTRYDELYDNHYHEKIEDIIPYLKEYYYFDFAWVNPVSWYERDYSSRTVRSRY